MQRAIPVLYFLLSRIVKRLNFGQVEWIVSGTAISELDQYRILYGFYKLINEMKYQLNIAYSTLACLERLYMAFSSWAIEFFMWPIMRV